MLHLPYSGLLHEDEFENETDTADWERWYDEDERFVMDSKGRIHETDWQNGYFRRDIDARKIS